MTVPLLTRIKTSRYPLSSTKPAAWGPTSAAHVHTIAKPQLVCPDRSMSKTLHALGPCRGYFNAFQPDRPDVECRVNVYVPRAARSMLRPARAAMLGAVRVVGTGRDGTGQQQPVARLIPPVHQHAAPSRDPARPSNEENLIETRTAPGQCACRARIIAQQVATPARGQCRAAALSRPRWPADPPGWTQATRLVCARSTTPPPPPSPHRHAQHRAP